MFQDASESYDPRSLVDERIQPWRKWWPYKPHNGDKTTSPVVVDSTGEAPWIKWEFDNDRPWEKPWIYWPLSWSSKYYGHAHVEPEVTHDPEFIEKCLQQQSPHPLSAFRPLRTTSFVQFFKAKPGHEEEKPYALRVPVSGESQLQSNFEGAWSQIMLTDVRGHEDLFSLDNDGFAWFHHACQVDVLDRFFDIHQYMREMSDFMCRQFNAQEVFIYDYVRRSPHPEDRKSGFSDITRRIHCDQSPRSAIGRIKLHMGDHAEELLKHRCRIFSLWRPMLTVIESYPLTACTYTSTVSGDIVPIDVIYPHYAEESFEIRHSLAHQWFWKSAMTHEDIMLIKLFDNKMDPNTAFYAPHGSWRDPNARKDAQSRRSIELRCMIFGGD
ncbi:uncharacterized protein N7446_007607 [Penicillium canescens]|uniref:Uncharacterized protein n=1 Tax=Penicillium canescens TaxID=5083 RepID=A0AAD6I5A8_PENCN|nr:uncharacterized protein N7446_007607 [Penicillium canescens]KAJ6030964.1 hypothetical protein N7460_010026 [Penicillium canescens]KAJ6063487.1 hypothetical protein N7446_007607 [Penicillium canescens]